MPVIEYQSTGQVAFCESFNFFPCTGKKALEKSSTAGKQKEVDPPTGKKASEKPSTVGKEKEVKPAKSQTAPKKQDQAAESRNSKKRYLFFCGLLRMSHSVQMDFRNASAC